MCLCKVGLKVSGTPVGGDCLFHDALVTQYIPVIEACVGRWFEEKRSTEMAPGIIQFSQSV